MRILKDQTPVALTLCAVSLLLRQYFVHAAPIFTVLCLAALLWGVLADSAEKCYCTGAAAVLAILFGAVRLAGGAYFCNILFVIAAIIWQGMEVRAFYRRQKETKRSSRIFAVVLVTFLLAADVVTMADTISANFYIRLMQSPLFFDVGNSFEASDSQEISLDNGGTCISDIPYGSAYPNGYLDIYLSPKNGSEPCPTFCFVHGGGFTWGDKVDGDPNGGAGGGQQWYFTELLDAGYNVVSINYALAPEYRYPTPVLQLCEATAFLLEHGADYGLDLTAVVYSGGSAGGNIVGQFLCAQTDSAYAGRTGIPQVIPAEYCKAAVFASALLDGARYCETGSIGFDFMLNECGRVYFGEDFTTSDRISETDIVQNVTSAFPPVYLSDGNYGSFTDQAEDLYAWLCALGVPAEFTWYPPEQETLGHGFEIFNTPCGVDNLQRTIDFLNDIVCS